MKNTFAVTMTLLLALALGGSFAGYRIATTPNEAKEASKGGAASIGDPTVQDVKSESVPSARSAATQGSNDLSTAQGNVMEQDQGGGAKAGENGAVAAEGGQDSGGASGDAGTTSNQNGGARADGGTTTTTTSSGGTASGGTGSTGGGSGSADGAQTGTGGDGATGGQDSSQSSGNQTNGQQNGGDQNGGPENSSLRGQGQPNVPSTTVTGSEDTQLGQTGSSNTEKAVAGSGGLSDSKAAEVASVLGGDTGEGQKKFVATCSGCHGTNGQGGIGPALNGDKGPGKWELAQFQAAVRQGHAPDRDLGAVMPRFTKEQLSDEDLTDIYAYLKTLRQ